MKASIALLLCVTFHTLSAQNDSLLIAEFRPLQPGDSSWRRAPMYTELDQALSLNNVSAVYRLDLSKKRLRQVPEEVAQFRELRELRLDRNKLTELPEFLNQLPHLEIFSAEENKLTAFPTAMWQWPALRELHLGNNWIESIPLDIDNLHHLEVLGLWSNVIGSFPASLSELPSLRRLDLLNNDMTAEEQELLRIWLPHVQLELSQPCRCDFED